MPDSEASGKHGYNLFEPFSWLLGSIKAGSGGDIFSVRKFDVFSWRLFLALFWFGKVVDDRWFLSTNDIFVTVVKNRPSSSNVRFFSQISLCCLYEYSRIYNFWVCSPAKFKHRWTLSYLASHDITHLVKVYNKLKGSTFFCQCPNSLCYF